MSSRYEVLAPIGQGGVAGVFVGRAIGAAGFSRLVALKRAHPHLAHDEAFVETMKLEARLASRIHHPNVVSVLDVEIDDGEPVLVLDYVEGCSLSALIPRLAPLRATDCRAAARIAIRIVLDAAAGLHAAHKTRGDDGELLGIVHRDVSPSNVLVGIDGIARIADFGIAKAMASGERTESGVLKGKLAYMAPEYVERQDADGRSDLFSLGVVAWEALTGQRLFRGNSDVDTVSRIVKGKVPALAETHPELAPLDTVLSRALARYAADRPASVAGFAEDLEAAARAADLVGTHGSVAELVEREFGEPLGMRRRAITRSDPAPPSSVPPAPPPPRGRDHQPTLSVVVPDSRPAGRDDQPTVSLVMVQPDPLSMQPSAASPPAPRSAAIPIIAGGVVALTAAAALVLAFGSRARVETAPSPPLAATSVAPAPEPPATVMADPTVIDTTESAEPATPPTHTKDPPHKRPPVTPRPTTTTPPLVPKKAGPNPYGSSSN